MHSLLNHPQCNDTSRDQRQDIQENAHRASRRKVLGSKKQLFGSDPASQGVSATGDGEGKVSR